MQRFIAVSDLTSDAIHELLALTDKLKKEYFQGGNRPFFKGKILAMIFQQAHNRLHAQKAILARLFAVASS